MTMTTQTTLPRFAPYAAFAAGMSAGTKKHKRTDDPKRAKQCGALERYFTEKAIFAAAHGYPLSAPHYAMRAILAKCLAEVHRRR
jgi:hypothetical protein